MSAGPSRIAHLERVGDGAAALYACPDRVASIMEAGLQRPEGWTGRLRRGAPGPGRGRTASLSLAPDAVVRLKQMRRGGLLGPLWRDRYPGRRRFVRSVEVAERMLSRGIPTARALALLLVSGPPGLYRAWFAFQELEGARDLRTIQSSPTPLDGQEWREVLGAIRRMHDVGVDHRDLNLGNILVRGRGPGMEVSFIDLDRTRIYRDPVPVGRRRRALWRLERSLAKQRQSGGQTREEEQLVDVELYADGDSLLLRRMLRGRWLSRCVLAVHRRFWR